MSSEHNASLDVQPGHLYVIATPIGNLADLTERARALLGKVDVIACEDTRVTGKLLAKFGLKRPLLPYHEHNEARMASAIADRLANSESVALVSDAGTPGISDPGFRLVRECRRRKLPVVPVPGASAITSLLSVSGLPTNTFFYAGFLPPKSAARKRFLAEHRDFPHTIVLYESCHRIEKLLREALETLGPKRVVCLGRELTKRHETILAGPLAEVVEGLGQSSKKGEFVVIIAPPEYEL